MWKQSLSLAHRSKCAIQLTKSINQSIVIAQRGCLFQTRGTADDATLASLFKPVPVKANPDNINVGIELTGKINKADILKILNKLTQSKQVKALCKENGLSSKYRVGSSKVSSALFTVLNFWFCFCCCFSGPAAACVCQLSTILLGSSEFTRRIAHNHKWYITELQTLRRSLSVFYGACTRCLSAFELHGRFEENIRFENAGQLVSGGTKESAQNCIPCGANELGKNLQRNETIFGS